MYPTMALKKWPITQSLSVLRYTAASFRMTGRSGTENGVRSCHGKSLVGVLCAPGFLVLAESEQPLQNAFSHSCVKLSRSIHSYPNHNLPVLVLQLPNRFLNPVTSLACTCHFPRKTIT